MRRGGDSGISGKSPSDILVSIVIPCYNPTRFLLEALDSALTQTHEPIEVVLVNDGSDNPDACELLESLTPRVTIRVDQPNAGPASARNAGFRAAHGTYILPLDADDRLAPTFVAECVAALQANPEAAFVYTDYRVFGDTVYVERLDSYNLYNLLDRNTIPYASLIRRADWELVRGYDESVRVNYEDWELWLRLGERGRFGYHLPRVLFEYRKSGRSMFSLAQEHDKELRGRIRANHPDLYSQESSARIKARWAPAVCVLSSQLGTEPQIEDWEHVPVTDVRTALERSKADAFLVPASGPGDPHDAEFCALAVWGGKEVTKLPDGAFSASRRALSSIGSLQELAGIVGRGVGRPRARGLVWPSRLEQLHRHLVNAELTSLDSWLRHPLRSLARLIPLRTKERINRAVGRPLFDLSFYLKFQMQSVLITDRVVPLLRYVPPRRQRRRIALVTPHLGPGGAESVLLELAGAIDRRRYEVFLLATQSQDLRWSSRWEEVVDHIYDLACLVPPERMVGALCSIAANWEFDEILIQNSMAAYSALPHLRQERPGLRIIDMIHAADPIWDFVCSTAPVAAHIDRRLVISECIRQRMLQAGSPSEKIQLIRNGVDLERFRPAAPPGAAEARKTIVFGGRLDPIKRPSLLVDIASELVKLRGCRDFRVVVAGDGPVGESLRARVRRAGLDSVFALLGHVDDMPKVLAEADVVVVPSRAEGIPLIVLEAMATAKPVVCSAVGAVSEALDSSTGILIDPGPDVARRFALAVHGLLDDPGLRDVMGQAGRLKVEAEYDQRRSRRAYADLFVSEITPPAQ
jgi:glycosyltransferase involved in cell wall biosynthesis